MKLKSLVPGTTTKLKLAKPQNRLKTMYRAAKQKGLTLVELIIVIGVVGAVMSILMPNTITPSTKTDALLMDRVAHSAKSSFDILSLSCGTSRKAQTPLAEGGSADKVPALIFEGLVAADYEECYAASGVSPNSRDVSKNGDEYRVKDSYPVSFNGGGHEAFEIIFEDVPEEVANNVALSYNSEFKIDTVSGETSVYGGSINRTTPMTLQQSGGNQLYTVKYRYVN